MVSILKPYKGLIRRLLLVGYLLVPLVLWVLPANFFDEGEVVCLSRIVFDVECYACGLTRAVQHAMHLEFAQAFAFNRLVVIVLPLLLVIWVKDVRRLYRLVRSEKIATGA